MHFARRLELIEEEIVNWMVSCLKNFPMAWRWLNSLKHMLLLPLLQKTCVLCSAHASDGSQMSVPPVPVELVM